MRRFFIIFLYILLNYSSVFSQLKDYAFELNTKSYSLENFDASPQIFDITQDQRGVMYFANQNGFIEYDGNNWRNISLYPETEINTIEIDHKGVIYAGGFEELGYLEVVDSGKTKFRTLTHLITDSLVDFKRVINIKINSNNDVFFHSKKYIFKYNSKSLKM